MLKRLDSFTVTALQGLWRDKGNALRLALYNQPQSHAVGGESHSSLNTSDAEVLVLQQMDRVPAITDAGDARIKAVEAGDTSTATGARVGERGGYASKLKL